MSQMYSHHKPTLWVALMAVLVCVAGSAVGALSWYDRFESYARDAAPGTPAGGTADAWASSADVVVTNDTGLTYVPVDYTGNTNALYVPQDHSASNMTAGLAGDTNVWIDMFIQPNLYDGVTATREVDASATALFFFSSNGYAVVHDGAATNWVECSTDISGAPAPALAGDRMVRVTVFMDYGSDTYTLFVSNVCVREGVNFVSDSDGVFSGLILKDNVYADNVWISSTDYPGGDTFGTNTTALTADTDGDGMADAWELANFRAIQSTLAVADADGDGRNNYQEYNEETDPNDASDASWFIPYYEKFVDATLGDLTGEWHAITNLGGNVSFTNGTYLVMADKKAIQLSGGGMQLSVDSTDGTNVFCQVYVKPVVCPAEPSDTVVGNASAAICVLDTVDGKSNLMVYTENGWTNCDVIPTVPTNTWLGLAVHLDYATSNWDLYVSTNGNFVTHMTKANAEPLTFGVDADSTYFQSMIITNESPSTTYVDAVAVSLSYHPTSNEYANLLIAERLANESQSAALPPYDYANLVGGDEFSDTLFGELGRDLSIGLADGDQLQFSHTVDTTTYLQKYTLMGVANNWATWEKQSGYGAQDGNDVSLAAGKGVTIIRKPGRDSVAFYPYATAATNSYTLTAKGTDDSTLLGRTALSYPSSLVTCVDVQDLNITGTLAEGDELVFYDTETQDYFTFVWSVSQQKWLNSQGDTAAHDVCPGDPFTVFRTTTGELEFVIAE